MSLYDEILAAQQDLDKLRKTKIFNTQEEAARYADKNGLLVEELQQPAQPPDFPPTVTATATKARTAAWTAAPRNHQALRQNSDKNQKISDQARAAGVIHLMKLIKFLRNNLNEARAGLARASVSMNEASVMLATTKLAQTKQELQQAEEQLIRLWNAIIAHNRKTPKPSTPAR